MGAANGVAARRWGLGPRSLRPRRGEVAARLTEARLARGLTQRAVAARLGLAHDSCYALWEQGKRAVPVRHRPTVGAVLGLDETDLGALPASRPPVAARSEPVGDQTGWVVLAPEPDAPVAPEALDPAVGRFLAATFPELLRVCLVCGAPFETTVWRRSDGCSDRCRGLLWHRRRRAAAELAAYWEQAA